MSDTEKEGSDRNKGIAATHTHDYRGLPTGDYDEDRIEKPWQRVPSTFMIIVLGVYFLLAYLGQLVENDMPAIVNEVKMTTENSYAFSEEIALRYLSRIVGDEPRVAGAVYHAAMTQDLKAMVDEIAAQARQPVRTDWQMGSGDLLRGTSFYTVFQNVSNIIALLEGETGFHQNGTIGSSILINCHYDSVPFALGASDNAVFCAVMAESLAKLSLRSTKLKRNIIFLFNGAEENGLQGSSAFLQHPWIQGVTAVINLDAAGMNGKPTVFQVTDPRVLNAYGRSVPRPNAQGLAEVLFDSGIIPSDTDFRIWRTFGNIQGIDIAFVKWASVYHTRNDKPELLLPGVLQGAGDMILALLTEVATVDGLDTKASPSSAVYFDYLNVFIVSYSYTIAYVVDFFIALFGFASVGYYVWLLGFRWSTVRKLLLSMLGRVLSSLAALLVTALVVLLMVATTIQMRYLTQEWIVVPFYWMPYVLTAVAASQSFDAWTLNENGMSRSLRCVQAMAATRLLLSALLLVLMCVPALNSLRYLVAVPLFIMSVVSFMSLTLVRHVTLRGWQHLLLEVCLSLPSVMFMNSLALRLDAIMLPIMARSSNNFPDLIVAMLNVGFAVCVTCTVSGIELLFSRKRLWMVLSGVGAACFVLMFIPFSPYGGISVQRHYWFHTEIISYDINNVVLSRTSNIVVTKHDPYTTERARAALEAIGYHDDERWNMTAHCEQEIYCGLPLFRTGFAKHLPEALVVKAGAPAQWTPAVATRAQRTCGPDSCNYSFDFTTANHNLITLWLRPNVTISSWSLTSAPQPNFYQLERPVYVVYQSAATYTGQGVQFTLNVTFNVTESLQSQPIVDLSLHANKIYAPQEFTPEYRNVLQAMPEYFNIASFISFRYNYEF